MSGWSGRHLWLVALKLTISVGLLSLLLWRIRFDQFMATMRQADLTWLGLAWLLMLASNLLGSWQWGRLLRIADIRIPFWKVCAYYHVGLFFNNFLPANIGGDIARVADSSRHGAPKAAAVSAVLMDRLIGSVALAGVALITTLPALDQYRFVFIYLVLVGFFFLSVTLLWAVFHPALVPACQRLLARLGLRQLGPHLAEFAARLEGYRGRRGLLIGLFAVAAVTQISRIGVHALVARALGISVPLPYFFLFVPLLAVIVSLPISLNGIGVREGAGVVVFGLIGVDRPHAFSLQFATYLVAVAVSLLGGLAFLLRIPRRRAETRNQERT